MRKLTKTIAMLGLIFGLLGGANAEEENEGVECISKGTRVTAEWDDASGTQSERVLVDSTERSGYECMGRCGASCGSFLPSAYTKDCMDHDQCSNVNDSSGGSSDEHCGDEFDHAADDWFLGVIRGCRG